MLTCEVTGSFIESIKCQFAVIGGSMAALLAVMAVVAGVFKLLQWFSERSRK